MLVSEREVMMRVADVSVLDVSVVEVWVLDVSGDGVSVLW